MHGADRRAAVSARKPRSCYALSATGVKGMSTCETEWPPVRDVNVRHQDGKDGEHGRAVFAPIVGDRAAGARRNCRGR